MAWPLKTKENSKSGFSNGGQLAILLPSTFSKMVPKRFTKTQTFNLNPTNQLTSGFEVTINLKLNSKILDNPWATDHHLLYHDLL